MSKNHVLAGLAAGVLFFGAAGPSLAYTGTVISDDAGRAIGIDGLGIDAPAYDVWFLAGTFETLDTGAWTFLGNEAGARRMADAINSLLTEGGWMSVTPDETGRGDTYCIPYGEMTSSLGSRHVYLTGGSNYSHPEAWYQLSGQNASFAPTVYTQFTPTPVPAAAWLLGSGVLGVLAVRKKLKK